MSTAPTLEASLPAQRQAPFLLSACENELLANDFNFLSGRMRLGEEARQLAVDHCVLYVALSLIAPPLLPIMLLMLIGDLRELRRIKNKRLLISSGQVLVGEVINCLGRRARGPHEDSDYYYEVAVRYSFYDPEGKHCIDVAERERDDLRNAELPKPGAPVRVLYLDERNYELL